MLIGLMWFIGYVIFSRSERKTIKLEFEVERSKIELETARFDSLINSINRLDERRKSRKRR